MGKEDSCFYAGIKRSIQHAYLKADKVKKYVAMHHSPYPEIVRTFRRGFLRNYTVWLWGNELYDYWEAVPEYGSSAIAFSENEKECAAEKAAWGRWRANIRPCFLQRKEDVYYESISELVHIDGERSRDVYHVTDAKRGSAVKRHVLCARLRPDKKDAFCRLTRGNLALLSAVLCAHHVGNLSVSLLGDDVYIYFEYSKDTYESDMAHLLENETFAAWKRAAEACMLVRAEGGFYKVFQEIFCCE